VLPFLILIPSFLHVQSTFPHVHANNTVNGQAMTMTAPGKKKTPAITDIEVDDQRDASSSNDEPSAPDEQVWKPETCELLVMVCLAIVSFAVALDATIIVTSLGVRISVYLNLRHSGSYRN
jgi:hypothetical protein